MMDEADDVLPALNTLCEVVNKSIENLQDVQVALLKLMESHRRRAAHSTTAPADRYASQICSALIA
jgi:hypothetical protein